MAGSKVKDMGRPGFDCKELTHDENDMPGLMAERNLALLNHLRV